MNQLNRLSYFFVALLYAFMLGCAASAKHESTGDYVDDTVITTKVKAAILEDSALKVTEINVETSKGRVQLSGFVSSRDQIERASEVTRKVKGVKSVINDLRLK
ncbi:MAG TPA: BON domain-containing protein [Azonexus sp.]|nr:BON domain-containing protein [Azonexus sp.]